MVGPNTKGHIVGAGDYQLNILLAAENARRRELTVSIAVRGVFDGTRWWPSTRFPEKFRREREALLAQIDAFERARGWLSRWPKTKGFQDFGTSYGLKHIAEPEIGYTPNGVFIAASVAAGFGVKPAEPGSPNALLNIARRAFRQTCR